jgi:ubiquinone/menaquinone biosynthesis C-methylase UbiE
MHSHRTWHYVDEGQRREWQNPEDILANIGVKAGITFMDIGCGNGFFTLPAAHLAGPGGQIYGLDTNSQAIEEIKTKAAADSLHNITLRNGKAEDIILCESCADIVFFGIVLHDFQDAAKVLKNARKMLKGDGRLVDLDWKKASMQFGPPVSLRFDEATASRLIESAGFKIESVKESGPYHYVIIARC